jgi:galactarate dehydratase
MSKAQNPKLLRLHNADNVAIVCNDRGLNAGAETADGVVLTEDVPQAHKVALADLPENAPIIRYGVTIGYALRHIRKGSWVREDIVRLPDVPPLDALDTNVSYAPLLPAIEGHTFEGYRNPDGSVGTRNILAISSTVHCVAGVIDYAVKRIQRELLPKYPHVDNAIAIQHSYGCGVAIDAPDAYIPIRSLRNIAANPNFGEEGILVALGCEKLTPERLFPEALTSLAKSVTLLNLQDDSCVGLKSMVSAIMDAAEEKLEKLNRRRRETVPASAICLGLQCGGSDAFSGAAANPAVGLAADMFVQAGATVFFSEVTEVRDGIDQLVARAASPAVARDLIAQMAWYDAYLARGGVDRSANTSPGNKKGGLNNIVEKAMGSIAKSGSSPISGVYGPGEKIPPERKGLYYVATPASDIVCSPSQVAAGMNVLVFVTGRGTPYGLASVPTIKVGTRNDLARRWHDLIDVNAGAIVSGDSPLQKVGEEIFRAVLDIAGGKRKSWAEHWGLDNFMAVFNPAPIT